eukprot:jgi/Antlo1/1590/742
MTWTRAQQHQADEQIKVFLHPSHSSTNYLHTLSVCVQKSDSTARYIIEPVQVWARMK